VSDVILLVAELDLSSLRNVVRMQLALNADEELGPKVQIVLNRVGSKTDITLKKAEEIIGKPILHQIPNDYEAVKDSRTAGVPLIQHAPKSFLTLPDALDLLVVCVESGLGLDAAMRKVCEEMNGPLQGVVRGVVARELPVANGSAAPRGVARPGRADGRR
jgi:hypothetical protein